MINISELTPPLLSSTELLWQAVRAHEVLGDTTITQFFCSVRCFKSQLSLHKPDLQQVCIPSDKANNLHYITVHVWYIMVTQTLTQCRYTVGFSPTGGFIDFAAKLNWEGRKICWGGWTPNPRQFQPWLLWSPTNGYVWFLSCSLLCIWWTVII